MKIKMEQIQDYNKWPIHSTRFLLPVIAIRGFKLDGVQVFFAFWIWQVRFVITANSGSCGAPERQRAASPPVNG